MESGLMQELVGMFQTRGDVQELQTGGLFAPLPQEEGFTVSVRETAVPAIAPAYGVHVQVVVSLTVPPMKFAVPGCAVL
jgi:hypothetical protein